MASADKAVEETVHYSDGGIKYTGFLLKGEMHGAWSFYRTDGSLMRSGEFDRGKQVGTWRTFDRSGTVVKETTLRSRSGHAVQRP
jgi:antitoxin component YwqK of YwqJK toxin-antitoxin module